MGDLSQTIVTSAAAGIQLERAPGGGLVLAFAGKSFADVQIVRAAPLSEPKRYICFLDSAGAEICMIRDLSELAPEDRLLAEEELRMRYITSVIRKVLSVRCETGTLYWEMETDRGSRELVVQNSDENVRWLSERCVLLIDVDGNRFEVPDISVLDQGSARMLRENLQ
jgi:Domain of unknown function (DUF1854)